MPTVLWWIQVVGGALTIVISAGVIAGTAYALVRGIPNRARDALGINGIDAKLDTVLENVRTTQTIQLGEAEALNDLNDTVCTLHDVAPGDRPAKMDIDEMREQMGKAETLPDDFTKG